MNHSENILHTLTTPSLSLSLSNCLSNLSIYSINLLSHWQEDWYLMVPVTDNGQQICI